MKNETLNTESTLLEQSVERMTRSKVDIETSDIFFNFGTPLANDYVKFCRKTGKQFLESTYQKRLLQDANNFLEIVVREFITPQDLVDDYNNRT